ncbi:MAG TPA: YifB family Mg chelatase-like AAA ATPase [Rhizomicrobium sp.]|nr:YifB family Mg chelatase-like AAA ATPase [Rhizomicrobium sp.]
MTVAHIYTVAFQGIEAREVDVQVHVAESGGGQFTLVGLADKAVGESKERVRVALSAIGLSMPWKRVTVNLAPADLPKEGSHYDLPIALGLLAAMGVLPASEMERYVALGELSLDAQVIGVAGVLPAALAASEQHRGLICPAACGSEAAWAGDVEIIATPSLIGLVNHMRGVQVLNRPSARLADDVVSIPDLKDVKGQETAKRALEIAAAGGHNMLMIGPPGAGKSMLAQRLPALLPPLDAREALEISMVQSLAGELPDGTISRRRPFRNPHHSASMAALVGGGLKVKPGEVSLAHLGVLFLDELPEFQRAVLDSLRQPIETGEAIVARANAHVRFPARFQLVAAMNPCRRVAFLHPHVPVSLKHPRPKPYTESPKTLGEHLLRRRLTLGLTQTQVSFWLAITADTLLLWEKDRVQPEARYFPAIYGFLGYDPLPVPTTLAERITRQRLRLGLSIKATAKLLGVDEGSVSHWERGDRQPRLSGDTVSRFLAMQIEPEGARDAA